LDDPSRPRCRAERASNSCPILCHRCGFNRLIQAEQQTYSSTRKMKICLPTLAGLLELICNIHDKEVFQILSGEDLSHTFPIFSKFTERTNRTLTECFRDLWRRLRIGIQTPFGQKAELSMVVTDDVLPRPPELSESEYTWAESLVREAVGKRLEDPHARNSLSLGEELENRIYTMLFIPPSTRLRRIGRR